MHEQDSSLWTRRAWLGTATGAVAALMSPLALACAREARAGGIAMQVYKTPTCGCCRAWVDHVNDNGFTATAQDMPDVGPTRKKLGVPDRLASCHTATVGNYIIEGHVPANAVHRLIASKDAQILGLAVPGMVAGSPGMEGLTKDPYDIIAFDRQGGTRVYEHIPG
jgi:hypothetical protein